MNKIFSIYILLLSCGLNAQSILTPQEAAAVTLDNNFDIKIAENNVQIAENNTDPRLNGYRPTIDLTGSVNADLGGSTATFVDGMEINISNAFAWDANGQVAANYAIYDARRAAVLEQLKETLTLSNLQKRQVIETNLLQVYADYYEVARLAANVSVLQEAIAVSRERLQRAQIAADYGQGTGLDVLNAKVDIQRDSVNTLNAQQQLENARRRLNVRMGRAPEVAFQVDTTVNYSRLVLDDLIAAAKNDNINLILNRQNQQIIERELDIIDAEQKPRVVADASYGITYQDAASGSFIESSSNRGAGVGLGLQWNLFDGGARKVRAQNAQINILNQRLQREQLELQIERDLRNAFDNYQNALFVLQVEQDALATNRENFERTQEQQRLGRVTSLEFRQAQLNLLNAATNLNAAKFNAKLREIEVINFSGGLIDGVRF